VLRGGEFRARQRLEELQSVFFFPVLLEERKSFSAIALGCLFLYLSIYQSPWRLNEKNDRRPERRREAGRVAGSDRRF